MVHFFEHFLAHSQNRVLILDRQRQYNNFLTFVAEPSLSHAEIDEVLRHVGRLVGPDADDETKVLLVPDAVAVEVAVRTVGLGIQAFRPGQQGSRDFFAIH